MTDKFYEKKTFTKEDYSEKNLANKEFDTCIFINCNFAKADLSNTTFIDCKFDACDLSMAKLVNTGLQTVSFINCKMLGVNFTRCKDFLLSFYFEKCTLDYANFFEKKMIKTTFKDCSIKEVEFSMANLTSSEFLNCDLSRSIFNQTILEKVDFRTAYNYSIDLEQNRVKKAKFSNSGIIGLLEKYQIVIE